MIKKSGCCNFLKKIFKKKSGPGEGIQGPTTLTVKTSTEENTEIILKSGKGIEEEKKQENVISENSVCIGSHDTNSIFYDKNSALGEITDKQQALENLNDAYKILKVSDLDQSRLSYLHIEKEKFADVVKGINFKEILAGEDSIILTERSNNSNIVIGPPDD